MYQAARQLELAQAQVSLCQADGGIKVLQCLGFRIFKVLQRFGGAVDSKVNFASQQADVQLFVAASGLNILKNGNSVFVTLRLHISAGLAQQERVVAGLSLRGTEPDSADNAD